MNASHPGSLEASRGRVASDEGATVARRRRRWPLLVALVAPLALGGCQLPSYWASHGSTKQGHDIFKLYSAMMTTGIVIGGLVALLILWTVLRYRKRSDEMPRQFHENIAIEIVYTTVPVIIVIVLFVFTVLTENNVNATVAGAATTTSSGSPVTDITVTGFQWGWRFDYPRDNVGVAGTLTNGPGNHGPQMVVPVGQTVQISLVSNDVIHGFYVRDFNFSRYAQPGVTNRFDLTVNKTGTFAGQCTQYCGLYHSEMLFSVRAVSPAQFRAWLAHERALGHTLKGAGQNNTQNTPPPGAPSQSALAPSPSPTRSSIEAPA